MAAKRFNDQFLPNDLVTVVDFAGDGDQRLLYPLGAPSGANAAIDRVNERSGTFIGGGIQLALKEITKAGSGDTAKRSALVVLTDGTDNSNALVQKTIQAVKDAGTAGVRVHFGFLKDLVDFQPQDVNLQAAIKATGGFFSNIDTAADIEKFVASVLASGLTEQDGSRSSTLLLPSLNTTSTLSKTAPATFQYSIQSGEKINVTITAITKGLGLKQTLKDKSGSELQSATSDANGQAYLEYTGTSAGDLSIEVTGTGTVDEGLFSIQVGSSLLCGGLGSNSTTPTNSTRPSTPTSSIVPFTGGAATLRSYGSSIASGLGLALAGVFLL